ncbi:MAG: glycosyltransferase [Desulfuromonas sp.]|nr:MAG: glycosyltransferase [Desulfuromonas sp.]
MAQFLKILLARFNIKIRCKRNLGYFPNLKNPQTYCEKVQWLKLNEHLHDENVILKSDKFAVRKFLEGKGLSEHLVKLYGCFNRPDDIDFEELPQRFVLKLNNASGPENRWFVKNKTSFDIARFKEEAKERMLRQYGLRYGEFHYGKIPPKIICEEYLVDPEKSFRDYKFYCFNGRIEFLSVEEGKAEGHNFIEYYDKNYNHYPVNFFNDYQRPATPFNKPDNFNRMVSIAERLSQGYPHVRIDLYNVKGQIYFGEMTYAPESGFIQWKPRSLDLKFGRLIDLDP